MRVLVVGGTGLLGSEVVQAFSGAGHNVVAPSRAEFDITEPDSVAQILQSTFGDLDWVVNCAAYTAVDLAESHRDDAYMLNEFGASILGMTCWLGTVRHLHISTDYVFDGSKGSPYVESDATHPINVYGASKLEGEEAVREMNPNSVVFRTSWLYGINGKCFPRTILQREGDLRIVGDQFGTPTYARDLAQTIVRAAESNIEPGIYHAAGSSTISWYEFAVQLVTARAQMRGEQPDVSRISEVTAADYPTPARRGANTSLDCQKLIGIGVYEMRNLEDAIADFVAEFLATS